MLLREEVKSFVRSLRHYSVLIFNFSDIKCGYKIKIFSKTFRNQRNSRYQKKYCTIAQKRPMLKQGRKTLNAEFIPTRALLQLSFIQFRPCATSFLGLLLTLTLLSRGKKILEMSLDLMPSFKTSVDARV